MPLLDGVRRTIRRHDLIPPGTRVVVAISGGPDSVALFHLLSQLQGTGDLVVAGLAHFNHQLRATADADEDFCRQLAAAAGLAFVVERADVAALASADGQSLEAAAHDARHAFFERARQQLRADCVAVGHTRDDQAETFLMRLLRGAGGRGLSAMHPHRGIIVRPLLDSARAELRQFLDDQGIGYRLDETNDDPSITRNRVRAELLPLLRKRFNPAVVDALAHEADILRQEQALLDRLAGERLAEAATLDDGRVTLDADALIAAPRALARLMVRAAATAAGLEPLGFDDVERVLDRAAGDRGDFDVPRGRVERLAGRIVLTGRGRGAVGGRLTPEPAANLFQYPLSIPGEVTWEPAGLVLSAEVEMGWRGAPAVATVATVQLPAGLVSLTVRSRRPGDRFQPLGLGGWKKLQDFFVDRKIGRHERDRVPLVVDAADRIIWVAGHAIDHEFRVKDPAQRVIILRLKGVGGSV